MITTTSATLSINYDHTLVPINSLGTENIAKIPCDLCWYVYLFWRNKPVH